MSDTPQRHVRGRWVDFRFKYLPALDGIRALSVGVVMLYHAGVATYGADSSLPFSGSFLVMEMFFVQSGFLITSLMLEERYHNGRIDLRNFYGRRAIRLLPAAFVVLGFTSLWLLTLSDRGAADEAWLEVGASLFYFMNWVPALGINEYPHYLTHFWSLAIEEQFYFVLPLSVIFLLRRRGLSTLLSVSLVGVVASALWMAYLGQGIEGRADIGRLYYGTDTRAQGLLLGVALAAAMHYGVGLRTSRGHRFVRVWAWLGVGFFVAMLMVVNFHQKAVYFGVFLAGSVAAVGITVEVLMHRRGLMDRMFSAGPLPYLGRRAYGMYLWHWPIMLVVGQYLDWPIVPLAALQVSLTVAVAIASYRWVEAPLMRRLRPRFSRQVAPTPGGAPSPGGTASPGGAPSRDAPSAPAPEPAPEPPAPVSELAPEPEPAPHPEPALHPERSAASPETAMRMDRRPGLHL